MTVRLTSALLTNGEAIHKCFPLPQSQTHSALQTLSLSTLDLKVRLIEATEVQNSCHCIVFALLCWRKYPIYCHVLLPLNLPMSHSQAMFRIASLGCLEATTWTVPRESTAWLGTNGMAWEDETTPTDFSLLGIWWSQLCQMRSYYREGSKRPRVGCISQI